MHLQTRNVLGVLQCCNCFLVAVYIGHTLSINAHILRAERERERERCKLKVSLSLSSSCLSPADTVTSAAAALRTKTHTVIRTLCYTTQAALTEAYGSLFFFI